MSLFILTRFSYSPTETEGILELPNGRKLATIERPWLRSDAAPGGIPRESCVPDGEYDLWPFLRPNGDKVYQLIAPRLGVYAMPDDVPDTGGRSLILIHKGNYVTDVIGCIAPGEQRILLNGKLAVGASASAMSRILTEVVYALHTLVIRPVISAYDIPRDIRS